jgi:hypothetical protein
MTNGNAIGAKEENWFKKKCTVFLVLSLKGAT